MQKNLEMARERVTDLCKYLCVLESMSRVIPPPPPPLLVFLNFSEWRRVEGEESK